MTIDLSMLPDGGVGWLDASGEHADIVLAQLRDAVPDVASLAGSVFLRLDEMSPSDRMLLHERHLVSRELAGFDGQQVLRSGAAVYLAERVGVMVNEEDHLRLQSLRSGFAPATAYAAIEQLDRELGSRVPYSFHSEFGFLTACPTNTGTGMRASVLIHLPGLVHTQEMKKVLAGLQQIGLTYRGLYGEGSEVVGNFFQLSNQTTLGRSEAELIEHLERVVQTVIDREVEARRVLLRDAGYIIEDKLWRAYGTLRYARSLSFEEAMNYLSAVRLGASLKLITGLSVYTLNKLLIFSQSAHLAHSEGRPLTDSEANLARARYVRQALANEAGSHE